MQERTFDPSTPFSEAIEAARNYFVWHEEHMAARLLELLAAPGARRPDVIVTDVMSPVSCCFPVFLWESGGGGQGNVRSQHNNKQHAPSTDKNKHTKKT